MQDKVAKGRHLINRRGSTGASRHPSPDNLGERFMSPRREKLTVELDPALREALARWALEEGRPVGNLPRRIVSLQVQRHERARRPRTEAPAAAS
jgi:hypothetical protein